MSPASLTRGKQYTRTLLNYFTLPQPSNKQAKKNQQQNNISGTSTAYSYVLIKANVKCIRKQHQPFTARLGTHF